MSRRVWFDLGLIIMASTTGALIGWLAPVLLVAVYLLGYWWPLNEGDGGYPDSTPTTEGRP